MVFLSPHACLQYGVSVTQVWLEGVAMADGRIDQTQGKMSVCLLTVPSNLSFARVEGK